MLIIFYALLVFVTFGVDDATDDSNENTEILDALMYAELVILVIFCAEIVINCYAYGFRVIFLIIFYYI